MGGVTGGYRGSPAMYEMVKEPEPDPWYKWVKRWDKETDEIRAGIKLQRKLFYIVGPAFLGLIIYWADRLLF